MKLKIYIVGFMAWLLPERIPEEHKVPGRECIAAIVPHVGMALAFSREEARAWVIEMAKKEMPESEGYFDHYASVDSIPVDAVRKLLQMIEADELDKEHEPLESYFVRGEESKEREM